MIVNPVGYPVTVAKSGPIIHKGAARFDFFGLAACCAGPARAERPQNTLQRRALVLNAGQISLFQITGLVFFAALGRAAVKAQPAPVQDQYALADALRVRRQMGAEQ